MQSLVRSVASHAGATAGARAPSPLAGEGAAPQGRRMRGRAALAVMAGLVPAIHAVPTRQAAETLMSGPKTWMAGTSPAMTSGGIA
jgi:hypothetical protein